MNRTPAFSAPAFWFAPRPGLLALCLSPLGWLYGSICARRMARPGAAVAVPVICIGNFTIGGSGKTPMAVHMAMLLQARGFRPFFLSRGYGGQAQLSPVAVDGLRHTARQVGDEPLLLAQTAPVIVCADRLAGARAAMALGADCLIMDDGLQNPALAKSLSLAMVDGATGFGNGLCLPAGPLRAALADQWPHVMAVVITGEGAPGQAAERLALAAGRQVFRASLVPDPVVAASLLGRKCVAFAGIGRPEKFFATLEATGARIAARHAFPDHYAYRPRDIGMLQAQALDLGAMLVTTQKDLARTGPWPDAPAPIELPVRLVPEAGLDGLLADALAGFSASTGALSRAN